MTLQFQYEGEEVHLCSNTNTLDRKLPTSTVGLQNTELMLHMDKSLHNAEGKGKAIPLQVSTGPEGSRRLMLPEFKVVSLSALRTGRL